MIPYLEEECVGYRFLRRGEDEVVIIEVAKDPLGQIAQALLDMTASPLTYPTPEGESITIDLRQPIDEMLHMPANYHVLRDVLAGDPGALAALLDRLAAPLPHALVLIIEQAEELFTLSRSPQEIRDRDHTLKMSSACSSSRPTSN